MESRRRATVTAGSSSRSRRLRRRAFALATIPFLLFALIPGTALAAGVSPVAHDQSLTTFKAVEISLDASDADFDDLTYTTVSGPTHGTVDDCSSGTCTYTPTVGYVGSDNFTWKANDGTSDSNVATVSITVDANQPPVAQDQSNSTPPKPHQITLEALIPSSTT